MRVGRLQPEFGTESRYGLVARAPRLRDRAVVRLRARHLDLALARGESPEATAPLALRAQQLTALRHRRSIAETYRQLVREARERRRNGHVWLIARRSDVIAASDDLGHLADELARPGPVAAQGVAEALLLLTDGTGPLHNPQKDTILRAYAAGAAEDLALRLP